MAIRRATCRTFELQSFVEKLTQRIVENDSVVNSFATHAKCHVNKAMDDWRVSTSVAKPLPKLSSPVTDVDNASETNPAYTSRCLAYSFHTPNHVLAMHIVANPTIHTMKKLRRQPSPLVPRLVLQLTSRRMTIASLKICSHSWRSHCSSCGSSTKWSKPNEIAREHLPKVLKPLKNTCNYLLYFQSHRLNQLVSTISRLCCKTNRKNGKSHAGADVL